MSRSTGLPTAGTRAGGRAAWFATSVRLLVATGLVLAALLWPQIGHAQPDDPPDPDGTESPPQPRSPLVVEAKPIFGEASLTRGGWAEIYVRISNGGGEPASGEVRWSSHGHAFGSRAKGSQSHTPFSVAAGATVGLRLPVRVSEQEEPRLVVSDAAGRAVFELNVPLGPENVVLLVDVSRASALGANLRGAFVPARNDPWPATYGGGRAYSGHAIATLEVASPGFDASTAAPILPERIAGYSRAAALLLRTEDLVHLGPGELEALGGYLFSGGTAAIVVTRPEDLRHPSLVALVGAEARPGAVAPETLAQLELPPLPAGSGSWTPSVSKVLPAAPAPEAAIAETLVGFQGGNLAPSPFGASAAYGLGEVHLLAFDPTTKPGVDSAWAHVRIVDLVRRGAERRSGVLSGPGMPHEMAEEIRRQLDPNEGARWAIVVTALLLFLYAGLAGPLNFSVWRKRGKPLRALAFLPLWSAIAFIGVTGVGLAAKGCSGRARHLTLVEAGAGMSTGSARRWRGFYVPDARELTVSARHASGVLSRARIDWDEPGNDQLRVDRDGTRLTDLSLRPWETVVVREDDWTELGDGIALLPGAGGEVTVVNRTGRALRGLVLRLPGAGGLRYLTRLDDGGSAPSSTFESLLGGSMLRATSGGLPIRAFDVGIPHARLESASSGLGEAWSALLASADQEADWFPEGVPVLLAQLDGGGGASKDAGLQIDSDRVLVRIVGFGGRP